MPRVARISLGILVLGSLYILFGTSLNWNNPLVLKHPSLPNCQNSEVDVDGICTPVPPPSSRRANATFFMYARNSDLLGAISAMQQVEERFNRRFGYPYVFLSDIPYADEFKERITTVTNAPIEFGVIPPEHWNQPNWIDEMRAAARRTTMKSLGVPYGDSVSYRNRCRFNAWFLYQHELMQKYRWYWRLEPGAKFHCNILTDPFLQLQDNDQLYGFTITAREVRSTVHGLWKSVKEFLGNHPEHVADNNAMQFISVSNGHIFSNCHFWTNFEIADMEFFRGPAYTDFFNHLDHAGGFYYERWCDAPIHSIALSLFTNKTKLHFFDDIGYQQGDWMHCPAESQPLQGCKCTPEQSFDYQSGSCRREWDTLWN